MARPAPLTAKILETLDDIGPGTAEEISLEFGHTDAKRVSARLSQMHTKGMVMRKGRGVAWDPYTYYLND